MNPNNYVFLYIVRCALPNEQESGDCSPNDPYIVYDRTFDTIDQAKLRQKELTERFGWQTFYTVGKLLPEAFI
jgi:hypothetical protein